MQTSIYPIDSQALGINEAASDPQDLLDSFKLTLTEESQSVKNLRQAARQLKETIIPVAFPTETVYGLGADATRSQAVKGIFEAKRRPADNPLIVHFASLSQLRALLQQDDQVAAPQATREDPIPIIYHGLIRKYWPGPLTIILPVPAGQRLAPEVTAGLQTFGARIPRHPIAIALIELAGVPIAAPSANASTRPSPTAAEHVAADLDGRIEMIIDGGPCAVGVESTVVDGLSSPPVVLRPGGISLAELRTVEGWEGVQVAYHDAAQANGQPRAPGMKYRHYSPRAPVVLYESGHSPPHTEELSKAASNSGAVGLIRTQNWLLNDGGAADVILARSEETQGADERSMHARPTVARGSRGYAGMIQNLASQARRLNVKEVRFNYDSRPFTIYDIQLGEEVEDIARGVFAALRQLDLNSIGAIFVEGIDDSANDLAAAIMNRLRKAAQSTLIHRQQQRIHDSDHSSYIGPCATELMGEARQEIFTVLVTGFESFDADYVVNPSFEIAKTLPAMIGALDSPARPIKVICHLSALPVDYAKVKRLIPELLDQYRAVDMVLHIGMAGKRSYFTIEQYAHRNGYDEKKDNSNKVLDPQQGSIDFSDCLNRMFSSFNFEDLLSWWQKCTAELITDKEVLDVQDLQASDDAGHYLCDYTYYNSLAWFARRNGALTDTRSKSRPVMFLHVPGESDAKSLTRGRLAAVGLIQAMRHCLHAHEQPRAKL